MKNKIYAESFFPRKCPIQFLGSDVTRFVADMKLISTLFERCYEGEHLF